MEANVRNVRTHRDPRRLVHPAAVDSPPPRRANLNGPVLPPRVSGQQTFRPEFLGLSPRSLRVLRVESTSDHRTLPAPAPAAPSRGATIPPTRIPGLFSASCPRPPRLRVESTSDHRTLPAPALAAPSRGATTLRPEFPAFSPRPLRPPR